MHSRSGPYQSLGRNREHWESVTIDALLSMNGIVSGWSPRTKPLYGNNRLNEPPGRHRGPPRAAATHFEPRCHAPGFTSSPSVPELGHSFLSFPDFLWAHRSGNSAPLRPTRLLLCRFRPQQHRVPSNNADASLRLHAPSLSVVPQRKRGRKKR
jgi:hypothetical protein